MLIKEEQEKIGQIIFGKDWLSWFSQKERDNICDNIDCFAIHFANAYFATSKDLNIILERKK